MDATEFATVLADVEKRLDRLRALYEQYFQGMERLEPQVPRKELDRRLALLRKSQPRNTALRFRYQQLLQKYTTYQTYWTRTTRQIEEGTYRRDLLKARRRRESARRERTDQRELERSGPVELDLESFDDSELDAALSALDDFGPAAPKANEARAETKANSMRPATGRLSISPFALPKGAVQIDGDARASSSSSAGSPSARPPTSKAPPPPAVGLGRGNEPSVGAPPPGTRPPTGTHSRPPLPGTRPPTGTQNRPPPPATPPTGTHNRPPLPGTRPPTGTHNRPPPESRPPAPPTGRHPSLGVPPPPPAQASPKEARRGGEPASARTPARGGLPKSATAQPATSDDAALRRVYDRYVEARRSNNERTDNVKFESVAKSIRDQMPRLAEKHKGKRIEFEVVVKNGRVGLKPVPK